MKESLRLLGFALIWVVFGFILATCLIKCGGTPTSKYQDLTEETKRDTVYLSDTIMEVEPIPVSIASAGIVTRKMPATKRDTTTWIADEGRQKSCASLRDSVEVEIPITQVEYKDSLYQAWISGFEPRLDSIRIFKQKEIITIENLIKEKPKRWHIGPTIGYGYTPKGFEPFIGVSITYSLISF